MHLHNKLINAVIVGDAEELQSLLSELKSSTLDVEIGDKEDNKAVNKNLDLELVKDPSGNTLLHFAVLRCLWHGIYQNPKSQPLTLDQTDSTNNANEIAATNCKIFEILLSADPNANQKLLSAKNNDGQSPLHLFHGTSATNMVRYYNSHAIKSSSLNRNKRSNNVEHKNYVDTFYNLAFPHHLHRNSCHDNDVLEVTDQVSAIDIVDNLGFSPLHLAVKSKCPRCIQRLLKCGASFNIKSNDSWFPFVTPLIFHQDPWAVNVLEHQLNKNIAFDEDFYELKCETEEDEVDGSSGDDEFADDESKFAISYNFCDIVPRTAVDSNKPEREMEFIESFLNASGPVKKQILGHPLVASFVFMKWELVRWMFVWSFILHIGLAILFTAYSMTVYLWVCPYNNATLKNQSLRHVPMECDKGLGSFEFSVLLLVVVAILALLELAKIVQNFALYKREWQNMFQIFMIISMWLSVWPIRWTKCHCLDKWQYSAAAYGIFHVWSTLLINMGRFPGLGIYVAMFGKVMEKYSYFMMAYIFLLIAFSISFCVVFPDYPPFETIPRAGLKVITMMSGEVDYGDFFYGDKHGQETRNFIFKGDSGDLLHPITAHILYGAFVILITILLSNLLIGLAVDDIKGLTQNAEFTKTTREIANIAYVESIIFWNILPNNGLVRNLRKSIVVARLSSEEDNVFDRTKKRDSTSKLQSLKRTIRAKMYAFCFCGSHRERTIKFDSERKTSSCRNSQLDKYVYRVALDDCKGPRGFPEDTFFKAVELIKKRH